MTIITTKQAAVILGINERSVRKATERGYLRCTWEDIGGGMSGRVFTNEALTTYMERKRTLFQRPGYAAPLIQSQGMVYKRD